MQYPEEPLRHKRLQRSIRPPRVVTLVSPDGDWRSDVLRMLECYSRVWGGDACGLIALNAKGELLEAVWRLAAAFDADQWMIFRSSLRGLRISDPSAYEAEISSRVDDYIRRHGGDRERVRADVTSAALAPGHDGGCETALDARIRRWLAPMASEQLVVRAAFLADEDPPQGVVDMCKLANHPPALSKIDTAGLPLSVQLLVAARTGLVSPDHGARLREEGVVEISHSATANQLPELLEYAWTGSTQSFETGVPDFASMTPFVHTRLGCLWMQDAIANLSTDPVVVVCGESADDFCYAFTRQRVTMNTYWLPVGSGTEAELEQTMIETFAKLLRCIDDSIAGSRPIVLTSLTLTTQRLDEVLERLRATAYGAAINTANFGAPKVSVRGIDDIPVRRDRFLRDAVSFGDRLHEPFRGCQLDRDLPIPYPSEAKGASPEALRWQADFELIGHTLPARWALQPIVTSDPMLTSWAVRSSTTGISLDSHGRSFTLAGSPLSQLVIDAKLRFPEAEEIFGTLVRSSSGGSLQESDKGRYTRRMIELWGGLPELAADLQAAREGRLLEAWVSPAVDGDLGRIHQERKYLRLSDIAAITGASEEESRALLDRYLQRTIAARGVILRCSLCGGWAFYRLEDIGPGFRCQRCRQRNAIERQAWRDGPEPEWFYGLDEVAYQGLTSNIHVPILALAELSKKSRSFLHMPEAVVVRPGKNNIEVDIWAVVDGRIILGEAKKSDRLEPTNKTEAKRAADLRDLAEELSVDEFVMATECAQWRDPTLAVVNRKIGSVTTVRWMTNLHRSDT